MLWLIKPHYFKNKLYDKLVLLKKIWNVTTIIAFLWNLIPYYILLVVT